MRRRPHRPYRAPISGFCGYAIDYMMIVDLFFSFPALLSLCPIHLQENEEKGREKSRRLVQSFYQSNSRPFLYVHLYALRCVGSIVCWKLSIFFFFLWCAVNNK